MSDFSVSRVSAPALLRLFCIRSLRVSRPFAFMCCPQHCIQCARRLQIGELLELSSSAKKMSHSKVVMSERDPARAHFDRRASASPVGLPPAHCSAHILFLCTLHASCPVHGFIRCRGVILAFSGRFLPLSLCRSIGCHGRTARHLLLGVPKSTCREGQNPMPVHEVDVPPWMAFVLRVRPSWTRCGGVPICFEGSSSSAATSHHSSPPAFCCPAAGHLHPAPAKLRPCSLHE